MAARVLGLMAAAAAALAAAGPCAGSELPRVAVNSQAVVGLSSGGYMAVQYHLSFSAELVGAGVIAGGPYYCSGGTLGLATTACMSDPGLIDVDACVDAALTCQNTNTCDALSYLSKQRVWLFSGSVDTVVNPGVMEKLAAFYAKFMPESSITTVFDKPAEHSFPTLSEGNACGVLGTPYISKCDYDAATAMLGSVLGRQMKPPVPYNETMFFGVEQGKHTPLAVQPESLSLGRTAYVYVASACAGGSVACTLVVALHGCKQSIDMIGHDFMEKTGLAQTAEANNLVVLFPQAIESPTFPYNPQGCFDFWGYTVPQFATQEGPQIATIHNMVEAIIGGNP